MSSPVAPKFIEKVRQAAEVASRKAAQKVIARETAKMVAKIVEANLKARIEAAIDEAPDNSTENVLALAQAEADEMLSRLLPNEDQPASTADGVHVPLPAPYVAKTQEPEEELESPAASRSSRVRGGTRPFLPPPPPPPPSPGSGWVPPPPPPPSSQTAPRC